MLHRIRIAAICFSLITPNAISGQEAKATKSRSFALKLLPGYKVQYFPTIDTAGGEIFKKDGLKIAFSGGMLMSKQAESVPSEDILWKKEQVINGHPLLCVYTRSRDLVATFSDAPPTNFEANIKS